MVGPGSVVQNVDMVRTLSCETTASALYINGGWKLPNWNKWPLKCYQWWGPWFWQFICLFVEAFHNYFGRQLLFLVIKFGESEITVKGMWTRILILIVKQVRGPTLWIPSFFFFFVFSWFFFFFITCSNLIRLARKECDVDECQRVINLLVYHLLEMTLRIFSPHESEKMKIEVILLQAFQYNRNEY